MPQSAVRLRGEHNLLNVLAACAVASAAGLPVEAMRAAVQDFRGVPHRLQYVRTWRGADWYNDSIATAPERSIAAIRSFIEPLVLLAGGRDKDLPWDDFAELISRRVDHLVIFGEAADKILQAVEGHRNAGKRRTRPLTCTRCKNLREAVRVAAALVQPGDVVLLSPGGTSFDEFRDFEERGECFVQWVNELP
jgi:UDP-N-acetylmuramoylalanine--D-glutamate ligase